MKFDFKVTTWERWVVHDSHEEKVLEAIKDGRISSAEELFDFENVEPSSEFIDIASEQMSVDDNDGYATIEVLNSEGETIYNNSTNENNG